MIRTRRPQFNSADFLAHTGRGKTLLACPPKHTIFSQGEKSDAVFYIKKGQLKLTVLSTQGKEAVIAILERGAFVGEQCLAGQIVRTTTATVLQDAIVLRIAQNTMMRVLQNQLAFARFFMRYLLAHSMRVEEELANQLCNLSEKRLAQELLSMAHLGKASKRDAIIPMINQDMLAKMIGTTRSRVSYFMNKFRKLGFIDYDHRGRLRVCRSLLNVVLYETSGPVLPFSH